MSRRLPVLVLLAVGFLPVLGQSRLFLKEVDIIKKDLKMERWTILEEKWDSVSSSGLLQTPYRDFSAGTKFVFIALVDECDSCRVELFYLNPEGIRREINEDIDRAEGLTRAGYFFELSDILNASFCLSTETDKPRSMFVILAGY
ncbi:MAG: hypothetical protein JXA03_08520 [Bacteroidales bacterium]|nr:hypothetical protein [Bacteroidales bacterium]